MLDSGVKHAIPNERAANICGATIFLCNDYFGINSNRNNINAEWPLWFESRNSN